MSTEFKPRPSSLPHLSACPRWVGRPKTEVKDEMDEAADEGTLMHAKLEALASIPANVWETTIENDPDLSPAMRPLVQEGARQVQDLFAFGLNVVAKKSMGLGPEAHYELSDIYKLKGFSDGIYCECGLDSWVTAPGTADLVFVQGNRAIVVDYKSNRVVRDHSRQVETYVIGAFNALPQVDYVEARIVAPRLGDVHPAVRFTREDLPRLREELSAIVSRAADPFTPGSPGEQCVFCAGNGRCPYQAATLRDIPLEVEALVQPHIWTSMLQAVDPALRGQRRQLAKWMESFSEAVKADDKQWALDNPTLEMVGFTKSVQQGRASLDDTRLNEINSAISLAFGWDYATLVSFLKPDKDRIVSFAALQSGITQEEAKMRLVRALAPFEVRGAPVVAFRAVKKEKAKKPLLGA